MTEIDTCLKAHELINVRLYGIDRADRETLFAEICGTLDCAEVQHIGNLLVLWRKKPIDISPEKSALATRRPGTKKQAAARTETRRRRPA
jgi:RNA-binding protein